MFFKKIILLIVTSLIGINICYSQQRDINIQEIKEYGKFLEDFSSLKKMKDSIKVMNKIQLKKAAKMMYEAYEEDAILTMQYLSKKDKEIDSINKKGKKDNVEYLEKVMPNQTRWKLLKEFKENFSSDLYALLTVPYLLKASIISIKKYIYKDPKSPAELPKTNIEAVIYDIVKGNSRFKEGDIVNFYYMDYWRPTDLDFEKGKNYFIPLAPATEYNDDYNLLALVTTIDSVSNDNLAIKNNSKHSYGRFPIEDNNLIDRNNIWNLGQNVTWEKFKSDLLQSIIKIKTW